MFHCWTNVPQCHQTTLTWIIICLAGDAAGMVGDNVDNDVVGVVCDNVKEQAEADDDVTIGQRLGMAAGTTLQGTSGMVDNDIGAGRWHRVTVHVSPSTCKSLLTWCVCVT